MSPTGPLKLALKRGALVTAANWPVVLVQFVSDTLFKTLLAVPIVGGVVLVVLLVGGDPAELLRLEPSEVVPAMAGVLLAQPLALAAFLGALGLVLVCGSVLMFAVKAGSVTVLVAGEQAAAGIEHPPLRIAALRRANQFSIERFSDGVRGLFARYLRLGAALAVAYGMAAAGYLAVVFGPPLSLRIDWPLVVAIASLALMVGITLINFVYLLLQIIVATENCAVHDAVPHLARLLRGRAVAIGQVLAVILALMALSTAASILATTALGLIAFVPFVGLAALPLQVVAWLVRGMVFQFVGLTGLVTYVRLHRSVAATDTAVARPADAVHQVRSA